MSTLSLWPHQEECLEQIGRSFAGGHTRVAAVMPTGSGKSRTFAVQAARHIEVNPDGRVVIFVHTDELADQAYRTITAVAPDVEVGMVKAARDDVHARIIVASKQTLDQPARRARIAGVTLAIVDECDLALKSNGYGTTLAEWGAFDERALPVVGYTATLSRADDGPLWEMWQTVAYRRDILWMIDKRYLIDVRGRRVVVDDLELRKVKKSRGDFAEGSLGEALTDSMAPEVVAKAYVEHATNRKGLLFTPTVESAYVFSDALVAAGIRSEVVHGGLPKSERRAILARLKSGETQVVCNCAVLTVGFDEPTVSCIVVARPTKSKRLYQQIVGRGLRLDPARPWEEQDCLLLDVVGASASHDLRSLVDLTEKEIKPREGQSLAEAEDEADREAVERDVTPVWRGPVRVKDFDPLMRASRRTWGITAGGVKYLVAGDAYVLIMPTADPDAPEGTYDVLWAGKSAATGQGRTKHVGVPLDMAMDWGEDEADRIAPGAANLNTKKKAWRREQISESQRKSWGFLIKDGMRKGDLSEAVDNYKASKRLDPLAATYMKHLERMGMA